MDKLSKDLLDTVVKAYDLTDEEHKKVLLLYKQTKDNINQFIAELFMRYGDDGKINYDYYLRHHANDTERYITEQVTNIASVESSVASIILGLVINFTYYKTLYNIEINLNIRTNFSTLRPDIVEYIKNYNWSGVPFSERIWHNRELLIRSLRQKLAQGLQNGESLDKIARQINKQFNRRAYESQRLIRTESARVITDSMLKAYKESGIVKEVMWLATLEQNTCSECAALDGNRYRLDDPNKPKIPKHPNCRCAYSPVPFDDYKPQKRKENETKKTIDYVTFEQWKNERGIN